MAVRSSMSALIAKIRLMTNDATTGGGNGTYLSDQQIQDQLDFARLDVRYDMLLPKPTYSPTLGTVYNDYYDELRGGNWEASEVIINGSFVTLSPATSDEIVGHWTFAVSQLPPVYIAGSTFDIYRAAADCYELQKATRLSTTFDFTADGRTINVGQIIKNIDTLIAMYRAQQRAWSTSQRRDDFATADDEGRNATAGGPVSGGVPFLTGP